MNSSSTPPSQPGSRGFLFHGFSHSLRAGTLFLLFVLAFLASPARAQAPLPEETLRAYRIAESAVRAWSIPPEDQSTAPVSNAPSSVGACITLKLRGEVIGRGTSWSAALAGPDAPSPRNLPRAIRAAMLEAEPKLGAPNDATHDAALKLITPDILIGVELAGPLSALEFDTWDEAEQSLRPGLDGVAAQIRTRSAGEGGSSSPASGPLRAIFPSQMMLTNMLPHRAMGAAVAIAIGEGGGAAALDDPKKLRASGGVRMYRFRVCQAVQTKDNDAAINFRGSRPIGLAEASSIKDLFELARAAAENLAARLLPGPDPADLKAVGTIRPGEGPGANATPAQQLLAAAALSRYCELFPGDAPTHNARCGFASPFIEGAVAAGRADEPLIPALDYLVLKSPVAGSSPAPARDSALLESVVFGRPTNDLSADNRKRLSLLELDRLPPDARPLVVFAALSRRSGNVEVDWLRRSNAKLRGFYEKDAARLPSLMPWLGWAEIEQARLVFESTGANDIPAAIALRQMRADCWKHQLSVTDAGPDAPDMAGGIVFTSGLSEKGGSPYPTWQCARPLAFIATMLGDPRLTEPNNRPHEIAHLMQAMRFLRQLQIDESSAWMYPDPERALGGIRASTWDNSLPIDATSMTLLCAVETIKSLDALSKPK